MFRRPNTHLFSSKVVSEELFWFATLRQPLLEITQCSQQCLIPAQFNWDNASQSFVVSIVFVSRRCVSGATLLLLRRAAGAASLLRAQSQTLSRTCCCSHFW